MSWPSAKYAVGLKSIEDLAVGKDFAECIMYSKLVSKYLLLNGPWHFLASLGFFNVHPILVQNIVYGKLWYDVYLPINESPQLVSKPLDGSLETKLLYKLHQILAT